MSTYTENLLQAERLFDVKGWVAVVTGGGTGLGLITTATLIANGAARVYITGRREEVLRKAAETYSKGPDGDIVPVVSDVSKKEDIEKLVEFVKAKDKSVNFLVNNASVGGCKNNFTEKNSVDEISKALFDMELGLWNETLHVNTSGMFFMSAAFLPLLVAAKDTHGSPGSILNVSSMSGITKQSQGGQFPYNSAKAGTISLTKLLAYEFRHPPLAVRVNTIAPGFFPSEMTPAHIFTDDPDEVRAQWGQPIGRIGRPTEYAQAVLTFAVNDYINGSTLIIDGGWLLEHS